MEYFCVDFTYKDKQYYTIWYSKDKDRFLTHNEDLVFYTDKYFFDEHVRVNNNVLEDKIVFYDLNYLLDWIESGNMSVDAVAILNYWNIFCDLSDSIKGQFLGNDKGYNSLYRKIFLWE